MLIISIELNGYKRFSLNDIHHFKLKPTARIQLILGTNGSGKSSLIAELSPLPALASHYTKDGSKTIVLRHKGSDYTLTSDFSNAHVHSFLKNKEELNTGGTLTVQKDLVASEFGIRQEVHDLITGIEKFTQMSPSRRREWFTEMSDANYDYALLIYSRFKDTARDINGALKLAKKRLVTETSKILKEADVSRIQEHIKELHFEIDTLYQMRVEQPKSMRELEVEQAQLEQFALSYAHRLFNIQSNIQRESKRFLTPEELKDKIEEIKKESTAATTKIEILVKEHSQLKETYDVCIKRGTTGLEELKAELTRLQESRRSLLESRKLSLDWVDALAASNALEAVFPLLQHVFSNLPENKERHFSQQSAIHLREEGLLFKNKIQRIEENLDKLRHQKRHLDDLIKGEKTVCPQCEYQWMPGYSPSVYAKTLEIIATLEQEHKNQSELLKKLEEKVEENKAYGELLKEYLLTVRSTPILKPFWDYLNEEDIPHTTPRQVEVRMQTLRHDLDKSIAAEQHTEQIEKIKDLIQMAIKSSDIDMQKVATRLDTVESELGVLSQVTKELHSELQKTQSLLSRVNEFLSLEVKIKASKDALENGISEMIQAMKNEVVTKALQSVQVELAIKQKSLNDIQMQQAIIDDISSQVLKLQKEEEAYKLLVRELSPTEGLIAEGLLGFIKSFIRKMNVIIRKIWTYSLEVKDCAGDEGESSGLDYKFPLIVNNDTYPISDVKLGSLGQKEVIDLAFKIVATHQLKLSEGPLYLDEWGTAFDQSHRVSGVVAIKSILEQLPFSQLFMISHYESQFGVFTNAEVVVLNKDNITVPDMYNEHVEMS